MGLKKTITFDRITGDYRMELDGMFIGYARNQREADITLNATAYEWLIHGYTATAEQLDGAQADDDLPPVVPPVSEPLPYTAEEIAWYSQPAECTMNVIGTRWTICGAPADGPCYCDVVVKAFAGDPPDGPPIVIIEAPDPTPPESLLHA